MCRPKKINCFNCSSWFEKKKADICKICGEIICPLCTKCLCDMSEKTQKAVIAMIKTYENYLMNEFKLPDYDFDKHSKIIKNFKIN